MKPRQLLAALAAASLFTLTSASAAEGADPSGTWKWTLATPNGDAIELSATLEWKDGKLSGTYHSSFGDSPIAHGTFRDGAVAFDVEREFNGNKFVIKYAGRLEGDSIKGTVELPGFGGGEPRTSDWTARRTP